ncbi:MAG: two-component system NtrC family sensor kinase [Myxococcota bacterium]
MTEVEVLQRRLGRANSKVVVLEAMIEDSTRDLYNSNEALRSALEFLQEVYETMPNALVIWRGEGTIENVNSATERLLGVERSELIGRLAPQVPGLEIALSQRASLELAWVSATGDSIPLLLLTHKMAREGEPHYVTVGVDLRARRQMEAQLRQAQKLESVGQLAAGVAHELNTPIQFVSDNVHFIGEALEDLQSCVGVYTRLCSAAEVGSVPAELLSEARAAEEHADLGYLGEHLPTALACARDGIKRVATIVSAMKAFSHPRVEHGPTDLNRDIETILVVANSEYKYIADVQTALCQVPPVYCNGGDIGQVLLNLIVNAAHAIEDTGKRGLITLSTEHDNDSVVIRVTDTGAGIPEPVRERIFDPFFTTKEVGRGSGQGLALAHAIIVDQHAGSLTFETVVGVGTSFVIRLPVHQAHDERVAV